MAEFIPNQVGQKVEENKEEEIIKNGGEITTDDINDIKLIDRKAYESLNNNEKEQWVKYNPSLTSQAYTKMLTTQNQMVEAFNKLSSVTSKMPNANMVEQLDKAMKPINAVADKIDPLVSAINDIAGMPIVGVVAQPLLDLLTVIGGVSAMLYTMVSNPYNMLMEYKTAIESIDIDGLKEYFEGEQTENLELTQMEMKELVIPDKEIKDYVDKGVNNLKVSQEQMKAAIQTCELMKKIKNDAETIENTINTTMTVFGILSGNATTIAQQVVVDQFNETFAEKAEDYSKDAQKMAKSTNDFIHNLPQKYIKISDLEKLKKAQNNT